MTRKSRITAEVSFEQEGKQQGFLRLPYSIHESAYGWIAIPIIVLKNGPGPNVLLMAGNHGDEYEGQIALMNLCRELDAKSIRGRIIILPAANFPAARAAMRTSPLDKGNLNRAFPGDPDGTPTQMIAHYIESVLLARCDCVLDLHSGGSSLMYAPCVFTALGSDPELTAGTLAVIKAFAAPLSCIGVFPGEDRTLSAAAHRAGVVHIGTELGGSGTLTPAALQIAERGIRRVLRHLGALADLPADEAAAAAPTRMVQLGGSDYYVYSPDHGLWEPRADLGDEVESGQQAALVHFPETPWREPVPVYFNRAGSVICKRIPARVERGDCLFHLADDWQP